MKRKLTLLATAIIIIVAASCKNSKTTETTNAKTMVAKEKSYPELEKAAWLLGTWGNTTPEGKLSEIWKKANDSVYHGESYFIIENDTVFAEQVDLAEANGKLAYTVSVAGQNNEAPVRFEMTAIDNNRMIFENPQHDFPQKIIYSKINNDSLVAEISGTKNGKTASELFPMGRIK